MGMVIAASNLVFFFSSRRRHTRSYGDWSSDVCSSDLPLPAVLAGPERCGLNSALLNSMAVLPGPLLHPMEEREYPRLRLCCAESIRGFSLPTSHGNC